MVRNPPASSAALREKHKSPKGLPSGFLLRQTDDVNYEGLRSRDAAGAEGSSGATTRTDAQRKHGVFFYQSIEAEVNRS